MARAAKYIYLFGNKKADGDGSMKPLLGGKGANLAEMSRIGLPVPPGFTMTTEVCTHYYQHKKSYPKELESQVKAGVAFIEKIIGTKFGDRSAMPLLVSAQLVTVLTIDPREGPDGHGELPGADIALHLARHGVKAQIERTVSAGLPIGEALLSRAADLGADLLVMGAYGHSRAREVLLGGATRSVLRSMTVPVLMSH